MKSLALLLIMIGIVGVNVADADLVVLGKGKAPIYVSDKNTNHFDFNNDGLIDYYVKAHYTGNSKQTLKVDYKIQDECVDGNTYEAAKMKLGFTSRDFFFFDRTWFTNLIAWNPWFKAASNDDNKRIDLVSLPKGALPIDFPESGDDVLVGTGKKGSFTHTSTIKELDGQPGWEGTIFFSGPAGEYFMWTVHPADGTEGCETLAAFGIPIIIEP
ncbi:MAG: hypothetical protein QXE84_00450 [Candidatus Nitrosotenuis sp.]|uniref:Uncharacterized protein n=1 Tax=Candidatus Nitrosotenuis uzonensis TaxID=1407055 RepID=A0A812EUG8_9ARCH|nr:hypothetical protein [Candidatus Nitrosotenuis uzonensis]MCA2003728.1 hypothetical protein [Candidatus Nitrosotenuis sp.]CAE6488673.1 conserved exported hypothetical protein [Candidatus Nitrosotenuis uzonensis]